MVMSHLPELIIIVVIALLILGPSRLPGLGKGVGEMIRGFRQETQVSAEDAAKEATKEATTKS